MSRNNLSPQDLEAIARKANFSSMNGEEVEFEGESGFEGEASYSGANDDMVDFSGASNFLTQQAKSGRIFTMKIGNIGVNTVDKNIILNPAYTPEGRAAGSIVVTDGTTNYAVGADIIASGQPKLIQNFLDFVKNNPSESLGFKIRATVSAQQLEQDVLVRELSPFKTLGDRTIPLATFQDENTYQLLVVTVPEKINLTNQTEVSIVLLAGETITITWFIGAIINNAVALANKQLRAGKHTPAMVHKVAPRKKMK